MGCVWLISRWLVDWLYILLIVAVVVIVVVVLQGEEMIEFMRLAIERQLAEINEKSRQLTLVQNELAAIHSTVKDKLTALHEEKTTLLSKSERLKV